MTLIEVLKTSRPYDEEGEETIVSRHAVDEAIATIAQQAGQLAAAQERIKTLEGLLDAFDAADKRRVEQLAAAEKALIECRSSVRLDWQNYERLLMNNNLTGSREAIADEAKRLHDLLLVIDAAIDAQKGEKHGA